MKNWIKSKAITPSFQGFARVRKVLVVVRCWYAFPFETLGTREIFMKYATRCILFQLPIYIGKEILFQYF